LAESIDLIRPQVRTRSPGSAPRHPAGSCQVGLPRRPELGDRAAIPRSWTETFVGIVPRARGRTEQVSGPVEQTHRSSPDQRSKSTFAVLPPIMSPVLPSSPAFFRSHGKLVPARRKPREDVAPVPSGDRGALAPRVGARVDNGPGDRRSVRVIAPRIVTGRTPSCIEISAPRDRRCTDTTARSMASPGTQEITESNTRKSPWADEGPRRRDACR